MANFDLLVFEGGRTKRRPSEDQTIDFTAVNLSVVTPTADGHAASKAYVDSVAQGLAPKQSAMVATIAPLPSVTPSGSQATKILTAAANGVLSIDGITTWTDVAADSADTNPYSSGLRVSRVLVKNQANPVDNGVYHVQDKGSAGTPFILHRATDVDGTPAGEVQGGMFVFVEQGTYADTGWVLISNSPLTVDTNSLNFVQFSQAGVLTEGNGIDITGGVISVDHDGDGLTFNSNQLSLELDGSTLSKSASGLKVASSGITATELNTSVAGNGLAGGGGSALSVNVDSSTIEINSDTLRVKDAGITAAKLASDVDLQAIYNNDADGFNAVILTNSTDGAVVVGGTESFKVTADKGLIVDCTPTGMPAVDVTNNGDAAAINITNNSSGAALYIDHTTNGGAAVDVHVTSFVGTGVKSTVPGGSAFAGFNTSSGQGTIQVQNLDAAGAVMALRGSTSGTVSVLVPNAFTDYSLILPVDDGTPGQVLTTDGSGVLSWSNAETNSLATSNIWIGDGSNLSTPTNTSTLGDILATTANGLRIKSSSLSYGLTGGGGSPLSVDAIDTSIHTSYTYQSQQNNHGVPNASPLVALSTSGYITSSGEQINGGTTMDKVTLYLQLLNATPVTGATLSLEIWSGGTYNVVDGGVSLVTTSSPVSTNSLSLNSASYTPVDFFFPTSPATADGSTVWAFRLSYLTTGNAADGSVQILSASGNLSSGIGYRTYHTAALGNEGKVIKSTAAGLLDSTFLTATPGTADQYLKTNGSGVLSWSTITTLTAGNGIDITGSVVSVALDGSTLSESGAGLKVSTSGITANELASDSVTTAKILNANVTLAKLASNSVDENKLTTSVAGNGLAGGGGTALSVNVDSSTIEINSDTLRVKDAGITLAKLASNSVDENKLTTSVAGGGLTGGGGAALAVGAGTYITVNANDVAVDASALSTAQAGAGLSSSGATLNIGAASDLVGLKTIIVNADDIAVDYTMQLQNNAGNGFSVAVGQVVKYTAAGGILNPADPSDSTLGDYSIGVVIGGTILFGATGTVVVRRGAIVPTPFSGHTPGSKCYVGGGGDVTDTLSGFVAGNQVYSVGRVYDTNHVMFDPQYIMEY